MIKVIETNVMPTAKEGNPTCVQSRIIEVESWGKYVEEIKKREFVARKALFGSTCDGASFSRNDNIKSIKYDERSLVYTIEIFDNVITTHYATLIED